MISEPGNVHTVFLKLQYFFPDDICMGWLHAAIEEFDANEDLIKDLIHKINRKDWPGKIEAKKFLRHLNDVF